MAKRLRRGIKSSHEQIIPHRPCSNCGTSRAVNPRSIFADAHLRFLFATIAVTSAAPEAGASGDVFTPVIASTLSPKPTRFAEPTAFTISFMSFSSQTRDPASQLPFAASMCWTPRMLQKLITSFSGPDVVKRMRTLAPAPAADAKIG